MTSFVRQWKASASNSETLSCSAPVFQSTIGIIASPPCPDQQHDQCANPFRTIRNSSQLKTSRAEHQRGYNLACGLSLASSLRITQKLPKRPINKKKCRNPSR